MIEIKKSDNNQKNASFLVNNDIDIDEEKVNLVLFDYANEKEANFIKAMFGKIISGINKSNDVYYSKQLAFDNLFYFQNRMYLDTSIHYFNTLSEERISKNIISNYGKVIDEQKLKSFVHDYMIRSHYKNKRLDNIGLSLLVVSMALSSYTNSIINLANNEIDVVKKIITSQNNISYGFTLLTKQTKEALEIDFIDKFENIYLVKSFPLQIIKVDKEIIKNLETNYEK